MHRRIRPQWWDSGAYRGEPLRTHLARHDIAAVFGYLKQRGLSWSAVAAATGLGASRGSEIVSMVSDLLRASPPHLLPGVRRYADAIGVPL